MLPSRAYMVPLKKGEVGRIVDVVRFDIDGPILFTPTRHGDDRGFVSETFSARRLEEHTGPLRVVQDNHTLSRSAGTLRGLHFQAPPMAQAKLVRVVRGAAYDVAVDIRVGSPTYGRHIGVELSASNWRQFWIPEGFAHGFCTLEPDTELEYKLTSYYSPEHDRGIAWNDPDLAIAWPLRAGEPLLSPKDSAQPALSTLPAYFQWSPSEK